MTSSPLAELKEWALESCSSQALCPSVTVLAHSHPGSLPSVGSSPPWFVVPGGQATHRPFETCWFVPHRSSAGVGGGGFGGGGAEGGGGGAGAQITFWCDHAPPTNL